MKFIIAETIKTGTSLKTKSGIKSKTPTKKEKYILIWQPYERYETLPKRRTTFTASSDVEACKKVFDKLYGGESWDYEGEGTPKTLQKFKEFFDDVDISGEDIVIEICTASGKTIYQSDGDWEEEEEEDWDD